MYYNIINKSAQYCCQQCFKYWSPDCNKADKKIKFPVFLNVF